MKIKVNNIELYYEKYGKGKPIILIHGNQESHEIFDKLIEKATQELEIINQQFSNAKEEVKKEFKSEDILNEKTKRLNEVNALLNIKDENFIEIDDNEEVTRTEPTKDRDR